MVSYIVLVAIVMKEIHVGAIKKRLVTNIIAAILLECIIGLYVLAIFLPRFNLSKVIEG